MDRGLKAKLYNVTLTAETYIAGRENRVCVCKVSSYYHMYTLISGHMHR